MEFKSCEFRNKMLFDPVWFHPCMMVRTALSCVNKQRLEKRTSSELFVHIKYLQGIDARNLFVIVTYIPYMDKVV